MLNTLKIFSLIVLSLAISHSALCQEQPSNEEIFEAQMQAYSKYYNTSVFFGDQKAEEVLSRLAYDYEQIGFSSSDFSVSAMYLAIVREYSQRCSDTRGQQRVTYADELMRKFGIPSSDLSVSDSEEDTQNTIELFLTYKSLLQGVLIGSANSNSIYLKFNDCVFNEDVSQAMVTEINTSIALGTKIKLLSIAQYSTDEIMTEYIVGILKDDSELELCRAVFPAISICRGNDARDALIHVCTNISSEELKCLSIRKLANWIHTAPAVDCLVQLAGNSPSEKVLEETIKILALDRTDRSKNIKKSLAFSEETHAKSRKQAVLSLMPYLSDDEVFSSIEKILINHNLDDSIRIAALNVILASGKSKQSHVQQVLKSFIKADCSEILFDVITKAIETLEKREAITNPEKRKVLAGRLFAERLKKLKAKIANIENKEHIVEAEIVFLAQLVEQVKVMEDSLVLAKEEIAKYELRIMELEAKLDRSKKEVRELERAKRLASRLRMEFGLSDY